MIKINRTAAVLATLLMAACAQGAQAGETRSFEAGLPPGSPAWDSVASHVRELVNAEGNGRIVISPNAGIIVVVDVSKSTVAKVEEYLAGVHEGAIAGANFTRYTATVSGPSSGYMHTDLGMSPSN